MRRWQPYYLVPAVAFLAACTGCPAVLGLPIGAVTMGADTSNGSFFDAWQLFGPWSGGPFVAYLVAASSQETSNA